MWLFLIRVHDGAIFCQWVSMPYLWGLVEVSALLEFYDDEMCLCTYRVHMHPEERLLRVRYEMP